MTFPPLQHLNLASAVTSLGVMCGLSSIILATMHKPQWACTALFFAISCDHIDGAVARHLNQACAFGGQFDSLADALCFCAAPALITWLLGYQGIVAAITLSAFVLAGLWRLAMYNVAGLDESGSTPRFIGLPTTNAAAWWLFVYVANSALVSDSSQRDYLWGIFFVVSALLMVSSVRIPKRGWYVRLHLLGVPMAIVIMWATA